MAFDLKDEQTVQTVNTARTPNGVVEHQALSRASQIAAEYRAKLPVCDT